MLAAGGPHHHHKSGLRPESKREEKKTLFCFLFSLFLFASPFVRSFVNVILLLLPPFFESFRFDVLLENNRFSRRLNGLPLLLLLLLLLLPCPAFAFAWRISNDQDDDNDGDAADSLTGPLMRVALRRSTQPHVELSRSCGYFFSSFFLFSFLVCACWCHSLVWMKIPRNLQQRFLPPFSLFLLLLIKRMSQEEVTDGRSPPPSPSRLSTPLIIVKSSLLLPCCPLLFRNFF